MNRTIIFIVTNSLLNFANAQVCTEIEDRERRLACFDATRSCPEIVSDSERLKCYERAYSESNADDSIGADDALLGMPATPSVSEENNRAIDDISASPEEFAEGKASAEKLDELTATITKVVTDARDIDYLELSNGHVWRENERNRFRFLEGREVRIEKGVLGSYNLKMEGSKKTIKVKRVR